MRERVSEKEQEIACQRVCERVCKRDIEIKRASV